MATKRKIDKSACMTCGKEVPDLWRVYFKCCWSGHLIACSWNCLISYDENKIPCGCASRVLAFVLIEINFPALYMRFPDNVLWKGRTTPPKIKNFSLTSQADIDKLISLAEQAPVGKGTTTVYDTSVRKVLQVKENAVTVEWDKLDQVLAEVNQKLLIPGTEIKAEFYKLLVYRPGDFFLYHSDSKKVANHTLTLAVDCGDIPCTGGEVYFRTSKLLREQDDIEQDEDNPIFWKSRGAGDWCCWFASTPHRVSQILTGYRIIATYNVITSKSDITKVPPEIINPVTVPATGNIFEQVPKEITEKIFSTLDISDLLSLSLTAKIFSVCITPTRLLAQNLIKHQPLLHRLMSRARCPYLGFILQHRYSFDGKDKIYSNVLRGRDYALAQALKTAFKSEIWMKECSIVSEQSEDSIQRLRVASTVLYPSLLQNYHSYDDYDNGTKNITLPPEIAEHVGVDKINFADLRVFRKTYGELDDELRGDFIPFRGVTWLCTSEYIENNVLPPSQVWENSITHLWGNGSTFGLYWYKDAAIFIKVGDLPTSVTILEGKESDEEELVDKNGLRWASDVFRGFRPW